MKQSCELLYTRIRWAFWLQVLFFGGLTAYAGRFFLNTDGLTYIEMSDGLRNLDVWRFVNLACSPLYPAILGIIGLFNTDPLFELPLTKIASFISLVLAAWACDRLVGILRRDPALTSGVDSIALFSGAIIYSFFLVAAVTWIKVRLVNPDMLAMFFVLMIAGALAQIKFEPEKYIHFILLGLFVGLGYLTKTYILPLSPIFFITAGLLVKDFKRAVPRVLAATLTAALVAAPLIAAISYRVGRLSFGEVANLAYITTVSSTGSATYPPILLCDEPKALLFNYPSFCTDAFGFDLAYWSLGIKAGFAVTPQLHVIFKNVMELAGHTWLFFLTCFGWIFLLRGYGCDRSRFFTLDLPAILLVLGFTGTGLFIPVHLEMRYVAPFVFLTLAGMIVLLRCRDMESPHQFPILMMTCATVIFSLVMTAHGATDQLARGLLSEKGKLSFKDQFTELAAVKDFLQQNGINSGDKVAMVGMHPTYWARMARVQIAVRIADQDSFVKTSAENRAKAAERVKSSDIKAIVSRGESIAPLLSEGWKRVPGATDFFAMILADKAK